MPLRKKGGNGGGHGFLSPSVRRLLREYDLEPDAVRGTGSRGRITRGDVVAAAAARWSSASVASPEAKPWPSGSNGGDAPAPAPRATNGSAVDAPPPTAPPIADVPPPPVADEPAAPPAPPPAPPQTPEAPAVSWTPAQPPIAAEPAAPPAPPTFPPREEPPPVADVPPEFPPRAPDDDALAPLREEPPAEPAPAPFFPIPEPPPSAPPSAPEVVSRRGLHADEVEPFSAPRRATAEHLVHSLQTAAHAFCAVEVDFQRLDRVRQTVRDKWIREEGFGLSHLPFVGRAVIDALGDFPRLNASIGTEELVLRHKVNLGIAVEVDLHGLVVPVVRDAETKRLRGIAREAMELTRRARDGALRPEEAEAGTFTITDPGPFGTMISVPIINHPEVAVMATEGVRRRPVVVRTPDGSDGFTVHPVGLIGLSFDHRGIETDYAAAFLDRVRIFLEQRDWEQEL